MMLMFHIFFAVTSVAYTTLLYIRPASAKFAAAYLLGATTLLSGTYLIVSTGSPLLKSCIVGLVYLAIVALQIFGAHRKLAVVRAQDTTQLPE